MTRINVVDPATLCDKHLIAEWREMTRVPNALQKGISKYDKKQIPKQYVLGAGHVKFFFDKLGYLEQRYKAIIAEANKRGFNLENRWPMLSGLDHLQGQYSPTANDKLLNITRLVSRIPKVSPALNRKPIDTNSYQSILLLGNGLGG